jgi:hypothetical protein
VPDFLEKNIWHYLRSHPLRYWLGYSNTIAGRTNTPHPCVQQKKEQEKPTWVDFEPRKGENLPKTERNPGNIYPKPTETESSSVSLLCDEDEVPVKRAWP